MAVNTRPTSKQPKSSSVVLEVLDSTKLWLEDRPSQSDCMQRVNIIWNPCIWQRSVRSWIRECMGNSYRSLAFSELARASGQGPCGIPTVFQLEQCQSFPRMPPRVRGVAAPVRWRPHTTPWTPVPPWWRRGSRGRYLRPRSPPHWRRYVDCFHGSKTLDGLCRFACYSQPLCLFSCSEKWNQGIAYVGKHSTTEL